MEVTSWGWVSWRRRWAPWCPKGVSSPVMFLPTSPSLPVRNLYTDCTNRRLYHYDQNIICNKADEYLSWWCSGLESSSSSRLKALVLSPLDSLMCLCFRNVFVDHHFTHEGNWDIQVFYWPQVIYSHVTLSKLQLSVFPTDIFLHRVKVVQTFPASYHSYFKWPNWSYSTCCVVVKYSDREV